jgi:hypothetical protein
MINHFPPPPRTERRAPFWCTIVRKLLLHSGISVPATASVSRDEMNKDYTFCTSPNANCEDAEPASVLSLRLCGAA